MSDESARTPVHTAEKPGRKPKKTVTIVALVALVAIAAVALLNRDRLTVQSDVSSPEPTQPAATGVPNAAPEIISLTAATDRIEPFSLCELVCEAVDPDGDALSYTWTASAGDIFGEGPSIEWGSPVSEGLYRVSVTADDSRGGVAQHSISLRVTANSVPEITTMAADSDWVPAGGSTRFFCEVVDDDGDEVTLEWSATAGELFGHGDAVIWVAPDDGDVHWVTVVARDAYGGESRRALPVTVAAGEPTAIVGLFLHGVNTNMLQNRGNDWLIFKGGICTIKCAVEDGAGPLTYEWSADFGTLTAEGDTATWTAPNSRAGATILVVVTNELGYKSSASVLVYVETCTCSF
jgi:hypothetical protein